MKIRLTGIRMMSGGLLMLLAGCATLDVTQKKSIAPAVEKQSVTLGIEAAGDMLIGALDAPEGSIVSSASGRLFDKVVLLPQKSKFMQPKEVQAAYNVDYILSVGIGDISVDAGLNPVWIATFPVLFFKILTPIVTFEPGVSIDVTLRDAHTGAVMMQKQVMETSSDHYSPTDPGPKVRKLILLTINNALVSIMQDTQQNIATARQGKKR